MLSRKIEVNLSVEATLEYCTLRAHFQDYEHVKSYVQPSEEAMLLYKA